MLDRPHLIRARRTLRLAASLYQAATTRETGTNDGPGAIDEAR
jgi:hypothetical protein